MIDFIIGWFVITQYDDKRTISIEKLARYSRKIEIAYDKGLEFIGNDYRKHPIEK